jgi:hypothetical protein
VHEHILPGHTLSVADMLGKWHSVGLGFYLAGGTELALHLGHRKSRDLDLFTRDPHQRLPQIPDLDSGISCFASVEWEIRTPEQWQLRLDGVSVTFLAYPFPCRFALHRWHGLAVADARDIAIHKAYTIGRRAQARDYLDLYAVLSQGIASIDDLIAWAQDTYGEAFSPRLFLQQLTYTTDLPDREQALALLESPRKFDTIASDLVKMVQEWSLRRFHQSPRRPGGEKA